MALSVQGPTLQWGPIQWGQPASPEPPLPPEQPVSEQLSELFFSALQSQTPDDLIEFAEFCSRFRRHAIFNARMIHLQRRGARAVASVREWQRAGRHILPDARPILILMPFAPVVQVYDIEDTGPLLNREELGDPFAATGAVPVETLIAAIESLKKECIASKQFRIRIEYDRLGYSFAGSAAHQGSLPLPEPEFRPDDEHANVVSKKLEEVLQKSKNRDRWIPHWRVKLNDRMTPAEQLVTLSHELGHIFCGHTGGCETVQNRGGWPHRPGLDYGTREMEAEAVAYLVASRLGLRTASATYLKRHVESGDTALVDVDLVASAASRIESLARVRRG